MRNVTIAAVQMSCSTDIEANLRKADRMVREAKKLGAQIVLLPELFETLYFCQEKIDEHFQLAATLEQNRAVRHFSQIAQELEVVLPISFFEKRESGYFNSIAIIDADGRVLGIYRKTHIPDGPGYEEKYYFQAGDTGFKVWDTRYGKIGVGICWDQWFPEAARCMALQGAEILCYPTAIGSEPVQTEVDSQSHWQLCMQGHAAANMTPVVAANRVGVETSPNSKLNFYGSSFITNETGQKITEADRASETIIHARFDLDKIAEFRNFWGVFRDRKPAMYQTIVQSEPV
jgi:N-carbamoylputrescine amidase